MKKIYNANWIKKFKSEFKISRPAHFTNYKHCEECADHEQTLQKHDIDSIGINELGNPGWDPICFCSAEAKKYLMPALARLTLDTIKSDFYLAQFLFHLEYDGKNNILFVSCNSKQRQLIKSFLEYLIENFPKEIDTNMCADDIMRTLEIWSK